MGSVELHVSTMTEVTAIVVMREIGNWTTRYVGPRPPRIFTPGAPGGTREMRDDRMWNLLNKAINVDH
jgi:hypothetical protein